MDKERIIELKIEDDDIISGVDQISLVDEPAIEYDWIAFKKEKDTFHIPEGEDEKYLNFLSDVGESEEDLLESGWVSVQESNFKSEEFAGLPSTPNDKSVLDTEDTLVRFRYGLNPIFQSEGMIIPTSRQFCKEMASSNRVYTYENLASAQNGMNSSAWTWRGSYNCRHDWFKVTYKKDTRIINKASVNKGKIDETAYGEYVPQPSTQVTFNKTNFTLPLFEKEEDAIDYSKLLGCDDGAHPHKYGDVTLWMPCSSHPEDMGYENDLPPFIDEVPKCKNSKDCKNCVCGKKDKQGFSYQQEGDDQFTVVGPAMVPQKKIVRRDEKGVYYVYFSENTIKMISDKFMKKGYTKDNQHDSQHDGEALKDIYVSESWLIEDPENDKANMYGFTNLPKGTWMVKMKVHNKDIWDKVKSGELRGFSVSGFFEEYEVDELSRESAFLQELTKILTK